MPRDESAIWCLDNTRPDLVENWFKNKLAQARAIQENTKHAVYGGLTGHHESPAAVIAQVSSYKNQISFTYMLTKRVFEDLSYPLDQDKFSLVKISVERFLVEMASINEEIAKLHAWIVKVATDAEELVGMESLCQEKQASKMLGELLVQIRGIAGDAVPAGHVSALGRGHFTPESACKAIYLLADAAHNLPDNLKREDRAGLLYGVEATLRAGATVFGDRSTFPAFVASED